MIQLNIGCAILLLTTAASVSAQPFKCTIDGKIVYQQTTCEGGAPVNVSGAGVADTHSQAAQQASVEVARYKRSEAVEQAVLQRKIFIGMTEAEVLRSWGNPTAVNRTVTSRSASAQWVYRGNDVTKSQYVYFDNGLVRSMQSSQ